MGIHQYLAAEDAAMAAHDLEEALATRAWMARIGERIEMGMPVSDHDRAIWRANVEAEAIQLLTYCACGTPYDDQGRCLANPLHATRDERLARRTPTSEMRSA